MKLFEIVTPDRTYFINADEVAYVEYSSGPTPCATIHLRGMEPDARPRPIQLNGSEAESFVGKLRVVGSVY